MAAREFQGIIWNRTNHPLHWVRDDCDSGEWQDPWNPSRSAGVIQPNEQKEWRSESDGIMTGTSGWVQWRTLVGATHAEFLQVNWSVPWLGVPTITCGAFRSDPNDAFRDPNAPDLEIFPTFSSQNGEQPALAQAATIAPYVLTLPVSIFTDAQVVTHPRVWFVVRERAQRSPLMFPNAGLDWQDMAMQSYRYRAEEASRLRFAGAFPNFHEARRGIDLVGGTVFVRSEVAEWRDVPLAELGNPPLGDFGERMRATNAYASRNGFVAGFPTYFHADYGNGIVCGTVLLKAEVAEWRDVSLEDLGNPPLDNIEARFRATHDYAVRNGYVGGFPNLFHAVRRVISPDIGGGEMRVTFCGTVLLKPSGAEWRDVVISRGPR